MLGYIVPFLQKMHTRQVTLLHVHDPEPDPHIASVITHFDSMVLVPVTPTADFTEHTRDAMRMLAQAYLSTLTDVKWEVVLSDKPEVPEILQQAAMRDADLVVIGRHYGDAQFKTSQAVTARRITEKITCSVLVLPEIKASPITRIIAPVRNSQCSATALQAAHRIATAFNAQLTALNVYRTPHIAHLQQQEGTPHDSLPHSHETAAQTENEALLKRLQLTPDDVSSKCAPCPANDPVGAILSEVQNQNIDLIVIGARGRTGAAGILLGAVTEELIQRSPIPVLAVKTKGECIDLLHAVLSLVRKR